MIYHPRNDNVLIRVTVRETMHGLAMPQNSAEGQEFIVVEAGPDVNDLQKGERVLLKGEQNKDWAFVPGTKDLLLIRDANVVSTIEEEH